MAERLLIDYLPQQLQDTREYQAIMYGEQSEISLLHQAIQQALNNQFIQTLDEYGLSRWEKILKIVPKATFTIEERRFTVMTRMAEQLPYTLRMLENMLTELCGSGGYKINLDVRAFTLEVLLALTVTNNFNDVVSLLNRITPANLILAVQIEFNQWYKLRAIQWRSLAAKTWGQLRNEVL